MELRPQGLSLEWSSARHPSKVFTWSHTNTLLSLQKSAILTVHKLLSLSIMNLHSITFHVRIQGSACWHFWLKGHRTEINLLWVLMGHIYGVCSHLCRLTVLCGMASRNASTVHLLTDSAWWHKQQAQRSMGVPVAAGTRDSKKQASTIWTIS